MCVRHTPDCPPVVIGGTYLLMNTQRVVLTAATALFMASSGPSMWGQETPQGTGVRGPRTMTRTTAVESGVITTRMGQGLHTTLLEQDGERIDRVSTALGVTEGGFVGGARTNAVAVSNSRVPPSPVQPAVRSGSLSTTTNSAPQSHETGIRPESSSTPNARQTKVQAPGPQR